jgi:hypothetical protein
MFLHTLYIKDGWRIIEQLQVLLRHSEEKGFFSANAVARAFNWALLNAVSSDQQVIARSVRDPMLLENCILTNIIIIHLILVFYLLLGFPKNKRKQSKEHVGYFKSKEKNILK